MSESLEVCPRCGARGLAERIDDHDCTLSEKGVDAHANSQGHLRLVGENDGEWIRRDGQLPTRYRGVGQ